MYLVIFIAKILVDISCWWSLVIIYASTISKLLCNDLLCCPHLYSSWSYFCFDTSKNLLCFYIHHSMVVFISWMNISLLLLLSMYWVTIKICCWLFLHSCLSSSVILFTIGDGSFWHLHLSPKKTPHIHIAIENWIMDLRLQYIVKTLR